MTNNVTVDLFNLKTIKCHCGGELFESVMLLKEVPAIMSPNGQEMEYAVQLLRCISCGDVRYPGNEGKGKLIEV